jgi:hypothetical protein
MYIHITNSLEVTPKKIKDIKKKFVIILTQTAEALHLSVPNHLK